jgi:hypothetical protein
MFKVVIEISLQRSLPIKKEKDWRSESLYITTEGRDCLTPGMMPLSQRI